MVLFIHSVDEGVLLSAYSSVQILVEHFTHPPSLLLSSLPESRLTLFFHTEAYFIKVDDYSILSHTWGRETARHDKRRKREERERESIKKVIKNASSPIINASTSILSQKERKHLLLKPQVLRVKSSNSTFFSSCQQLSFSSSKLLKTMHFKFRQIFLFLSFQALFFIPIASTTQSGLLGSNDNSLMGKFFFNRLDEWIDRINFTLSSYEEINVVERISDTCLDHLVFLLNSARDRHPWALRGEYDSFAFEIIASHIVNSIAVFLLFC